MPQAIVDILSEGDSELLYQVAQASLRQCDRTESFLLLMNNRAVSFRACELLAFRRRIQEIDIASLVASNTPDLEIVHLPHCDRLWVLTIHEVLALRELLAGSFAMLELNSIIHRRIIRKSL